mmetsp:Transcript_8688/g.32036  ORF Transcript_8688/g.32036 Transcript_8688/m.32036 type:complete len:207 (+) Transcript_8688:177-797(+)
MGSADEQGAEQQPPVPEVMEPVVPEVVTAAPLEMQEIVENVPLPVDKYPLIDSQTAALLGGVNKLVIQQDIKWVEAITQGCIEQANSYKIFDQTRSSMFMKVQEESNDCNRCFCAPNHSFLLRFTAVDAAGNPLFPVMTMERVGCCKKCVACWTCCECCIDAMRLHAGEVRGVPGELPSDQVGDGHSESPSECSSLDPFVLRKHED